MAIVKGKFESDFVTIKNDVARDTSLSFQARGLLVYLLSLPGDWKVHRNQVAKENGINPKTLQKYLNELRDAGYSEYTVKKISGRFCGGDYVIYPTPQVNLLAKAANDAFPEEESQKPVVARDCTADPKTGSPEIWAGGEVGQPIKKELYKERDKQRTTTTTARARENSAVTDFDRFAVALVASLKEKLAEGGWLPQGTPAPRASWLKPKAQSLFNRLVNKGKSPDPNDCSVWILQDWTNLVTGEPLAA